MSMKEIIIPIKFKRRRTPNSKEFYHYRLWYTTKNLAVYSCLETGGTECFRKLDFIGKNDDRDRKPKYE